MLCHLPRLFLPLKTSPMSPDKALPPSNNFSNKPIWLNTVEADPFSSLLESINWPGNEF
jgi:hypothetical protein